MFPGNTEFALIDWIRNQPSPEKRVKIGPGDDCASVLIPTTQPLLITTDMLLEGSCFLLEEAGPFRVGRKAMSVNLSDIAAMAGIPLAAVVSVGLPRTQSRSLAEQLYLGMRAVADRFQVPIVGGDTNSWTGKLVISVTVFGQETPRGAVQRNGAKPSDWIFVTGSLGGSIRSRHLDFTPRVREALQLHEQADLHSMIDISDGLAKDLHHLCTESRCGAVLFADRIPIHPDAELESQRDGRSPLEHALGDGEDFELLFTVDPATGQKLIDQGTMGEVTLHWIGECVAEGVWLEQNGQRSVLPPLGYEHSLE